MLYYMLYVILYIIYYILYYIILYYIYYDNIIYYTLIFRVPGQSFQRQGLVLTQHSTSALCRVSQSFTVLFHL